MIFGAGETYDPPREPKGIRDQFIAALESTGRAGVSETPAFILADYLLGCLEDYETALKTRDDFTQNKGLKNDYTPCN